MEILISFVIVAAFVAVFRAPLQRYPVVFYLLAAALDVVHISGVLKSVAPAVWVLAYPYLQRSLIAIALLVIVMWVGTLPSGSTLCRILMPIRGNLSILAATLALSHFAGYFAEYASRIASGFLGISISMRISFVVSALLVVLLGLLTITSFATVIRRIPRTVWKRTQRMSYVFFGLTYVHVVLMLAPSAITGGNAWVRLVLYTCIFGGYAVLRIRRHVIDCRESAPIEAAVAQ